MVPAFACKWLIGTRAALLVSLALQTLLPRAASAFAGDPVRLANVNWHSADLLTQVHRQLLETRGIVSSEIAPEFTSSQAAADAVRRGDVDLFAECWNNCTDGTLSKRLGLNGTEGIFVPSYLVERRPALANWTGFDGSTLLAEGLSLIGPPPFWSAHSSMVRLSEHLGVQFFEPRDERHLLLEVIQRLKWRQPFAFFFWEPHILTNRGVYDVQPVQLPNDPATGGAFFPSSELWTIWSTRLKNTNADVVLSGRSWNVGTTDINGMLKNMVTDVSLWAPDGTTGYEQASDSSARRWLCEQGDLGAIGTPGFCNKREKWPRERAEDLPSRLRLLTRDCLGFAKCKSDDGRQLEEPQDGYAVEHYRELMAQLGYSSNSYSIECLHEAMSDALQRISRGLGDAFHACITITAARQDLVDFTAAFYSTGLRLLVLRPKANPLEGFWILFEPFAVETWLVLVVTTLATGACISIAELCTTQLRARRREPADFPDVLRTTSTVKNKVREAGRMVRVTGSGVLIAAEAMAGERPELKQMNSKLARGLLRALNISSVIALSLYTAKLASILTLQKLKVDIDSIAQLRQGGRKVVIICNTSVDAWLSTYEPSVKLICVTNYPDLARAITDKRAAAGIADAQVLAYLERSDCNLLVVGDAFGPQEYGIALPKGSPLLAPMSAAVSYLRDKPGPLYAKYFAPVSTCSAASGDSDPVRPSSLLGLPAGCVAVLVLILAWSGLERLMLLVLAGPPAAEARASDATPRMICTFAEDADGAAPECGVRVAHLAVGWEAAAAGSPAANCEAN